MSDRIIESWEADSLDPEERKRASRSKQSSRKSQHQKEKTAETPIILPPSTAGGIMMPTSEIIDFSEGTDSYV